MPGTPFETKCTILGLLLTFYGESEDPNWVEFFEWASVGLNIAFYASVGYVDPKDEGRDLVEESWAGFCEVIGIDPDGSYVNIGECFSASSHGPLSG